LFLAQCGGIASQSILVSNFVRRFRAMTIFFFNIEDCDVWHVAGVD